MSEWRIRLKGHQFDLEELERSSGGLWEVTRDSEGFFLRSERFEPLTEANKVREQGRQLLHTINGAARVSTASFKPVQMDCVTKQENDGRTHHFVEIALALDARSRVTGSLIGTEPDGNRTVPENTESEIERLVALAAEDPFVDKAIRLYDKQDHTPSTLRRIFEIIEKDFGQPSKMEKHGWGERAEIQRFVESMSDPEVSGDEAEHGYSKPMRYPPMPLPEAKSLLRSLLRKWLAWKQQQKG